VAKGLYQRVQRTEVWRSVFRHPQLDTPRGRALQSFSNVFLHVYPVKVPARVLRLRYSWRLGFIATVLFAILVLTGIYLMFFYTPPSPRPTATCSACAPASASGSSSATSTGGRPT
jgi:quinol-cytochrome oxidoreductase complex cytochrome b subunit